MNKVSPMRSVVMEKEMPHAPEKVWRALTQSALLQEWLMDNDFQPTVGHKFNLRTTPMPQWNGVIDCEVLEIEPYKKLSYTWNVGEDPVYGLKTVVTFTLTPTQSGVLVRMEQSGFREDQEANFKGANYGWQKFFAALERVVAA
jgi:uncharacterized protein YndB with AHSA1/START domain